MASITLKFKEKLKFDLCDSEKNIAEVGQAMKTEKPHLFVTLTLNMKKHYGISAIMNAIERMFPDKAAEEYKATLQLYLPVMLQMWHGTVNNLIDYLLNSAERILVHIIKTWGRAGFHDSVANLETLIKSTKKHFSMRFMTSFILHCEL